MANAQVAEELGAGGDAFGDLPEGKAVTGDDGFAFWVYVQGHAVGLGEGGPLEGAFGVEPFEVDAVVFAGFFVVAEAGFDVDGGDVVICFDDEGAFDDFDDVVEGVVDAFDEGSAHVGVDAAGEEEEKDGGDGGVPEGEAAAGGLEHCEGERSVSHRRLCDVAHDNPISFLAFGVVVMAFGVWVGFYFSDRVLSELTS